MMAKPVPCRIITICGSMAFSDQMRQLGHQLERMGFIVLSPLEEEEEAHYEILTEQAQTKVKRQFIDKHLDKIKPSDAVLIANFEKRGIPGYIGANTLIEIAFAYAFEKRIFVLNPVGEQGCKVEVLGMQSLNLAGDLRNLTFG